LNRSQDPGTCSLGIGANLVPFVPGPLDLPLFGQFLGLILKNTSPGVAIVSQHVQPSRLLTAVPEPGGRIEPKLRRGHFLVRLNYQVAKDRIKRVRKWAQESSGFGAAQAERMLRRAVYSPELGEERLFQQPKATVLYYVLAVQTFLSNLEMSMVNWARIEGSRLSRRTFPGGPGARSRLSLFRSATRHGVPY